MGKIILKAEALGGHLSVAGKGYLAVLNGRAYIMPGLGDNTVVKADK